MRFIASSDKHLQLNIPRCRIDDDWLQTQKNLLQFIANEANKRKCPVYDFGDIFDTAKVPSIIISMFLEFAFSVNAGIRILAGNHSLLYHSMDNIDESSFGIIDKIVKSKDKRIQYFDDIGMYSHFSEELKGKDTSLLFIHRLVFENKKSLPPNVQACTAQDLLDEYPTMKWIFVGDQHHSFHYEKKGRHVINPGCMYRGASDFKNYQPIVYFIDTDKEIIEEIELPDNGKMVDDSYIIEEKERTDRLDSFVERLKKDGNIELDFLSNIENALNKNKKMSKDTIICIRELCEMEDIK